MEHQFTDGRRLGSYHATEYGSFFYRACKPLHQRLAGRPIEFRLMRRTTRTADAIICRYVGNEISCSMQEQIGCFIVEASGAQEGSMEAERMLHLTVTRDEI